jgi:putative transposase
MRKSAFFTVEILFDSTYNFKVPIKTFKYRIYPTRAQQTQLQRVLDACRWVYNQVLETRKTAWETEQRLLSLFETINFLPGWKIEQESLKKAHAQVLQNVCARVDLAFKAFFRRVRAGETPGFPRFRGRHRYDSFTYPGTGFTLSKDGRLDLSKIGRVKIILHRPLGGTIKTLTIRRTSTGKWFACFCCEVEKDLLPANTDAVGIDLGLAKFAVLSTGEMIENPRFFHHQQKVLAKVQRRLAQEAKGTPERRFRRKAVAFVHERVANKRKDFTHKLSRRFVLEFGTLCFEDLKIKNMVRGNFAKSILDAAWSQLISYTANKAAWAGRTFVLVNPRNTSKMCSRCGELVNKTLADRIHDCPACGLVLDRDHNAALNVLRLGLQSLGSVPVEAPGF